MNRTEERKITFEILYTLPFNPQKSCSDIIDTYIEANEYEQLSDYVVSTVNGVFDNLDFIDTKIKENIKTRKFERLDNVCLTAMRYAVYEMFYNNEVPQIVAINEAIELTKKYDPELASFVHANLGTISKLKDE